MSSGVMARPCGSPAPKFMLASTVRLAMSIIDVPALNGLATKTSAPLLLAAMPLAVEQTGIVAVTDRVPAPISETWSPSRLLTDTRPRDGSGIVATGHWR